MTSFEDVPLSSMPAPATRVVSLGKRDQLAWRQLFALGTTVDDVQEAAHEGLTIDTLDELRALRELLDATVETVVGMARVDGRSWSEIGHALGVTKQGARQRWGRDAL